MYFHTHIVVAFAFLLLRPRIVYAANSGTLYTLSLGLLAGLVNSYLALSFFQFSLYHFSKRRLLQLGVLHLNALKRISSNVSFQVPIKLCVSIPAFN